MCVQFWGGVDVLAVLHYLTTTVLLHCYTVLFTRTCLDSPSLSVLLVLVFYSHFCSEFMCRFVCEFKYVDVHVFLFPCGEVLACI